MSDLVSASGYFHQAYRTYATEQGHDPSIGKAKADEISAQTAAMSHAGGDFAVDSVYISTQASEMYLENVRKRQVVDAKASLAHSDESHSATHEESVGQEANDRESPARIDLVHNEQKGFPL